MFRQGYAVHGLSGCHGAAARVETRIDKHKPVEAASIRLSLSRAGRLSEKGKRQNEGAHTEALGFPQGRGEIGDRYIERAEDRAIPRPVVVYFG